MIDRKLRYQMPTTVDEAADLLIGDLPPELRAAMREMDESAFEALCEQLTPYLQFDLNLWTGNDRLLSSCFEDTGEQPHTDPMRIIMERVRLRLLIHNEILMDVDSQ